MAWNEFYMQTTGSNLNAGSTVANAASLTYALGTFVQGTGIFTVAAGNPLTDGVAVDDWVSIYTHDAAGAQFVAQVTARDATTISVDITTHKIGVITNINEGAGESSLKVGGAWGGDVGVITSLFVAATHTIPIRVNIKSGNYTAGAARTIAATGTATCSAWWRGYNAAIGDLDPGQAGYADDSKYPVIIMGTSILSFGAAHNFYSNIAATTAKITTGGGIVSGAVTGMTWFRCKFEATEADADSLAFSCGTASSGAVFVLCSFKATSTSANVVSLPNAATPCFYGCVFKGGGNSANIASGTSAGASFLFCLFYNASYGIYSSSTATSSNVPFLILNCIFYNITNDAIYMANVPVTGGAGLRMAANNIFHTIGGYAFNQASGGNCDQFMRMNNLIYSVGLGTTPDFEAGFGDYPAYFNVADANQIFTSTDDTNANFMKMVSGCVGKGVAFPSNVFEGLATQSYGDIGALQRAEPATVGMSWSRKVRLIKHE